MKWVFGIMFLLAGCENLKHATNVNFSDMKNMRHDEALMAKLDKRVEVIDSKRAKYCSFIKDIIGRDNVLDQGMKYALYYAKYETFKLDGNSMVILKKEKVGDYGSRVRARAYRCPGL